MTVFHINCYRASGVGLVAGVDNSDDTALIDIVVFSPYLVLTVLGVKLDSDVQTSPRKFVLTINVNCAD